VKLYRPATIVVGVLFVLLGGLTRLATPDQVYEKQNMEIVKGTIGEELAYGAGGTTVKITRMKFAQAILDEGASDDDKPIETTGAYVVLEWDAVRGVEKPNIANPTLVADGGSVYGPVDGVNNSGLDFPDAGFARTGAIVFEVNPSDHALQRPGVRDPRRSGSSHGGDRPEAHRRRGAAVRGAGTGDPGGVMRIASRVSRLAVQIGLLAALLATASFVMLRPYLTDEERLYNEGRIDQVVSKGPVTVGTVEWKLDSLEAYARLVDDEGEKIAISQPAGSVIMVATMTVTPLAGEYLKDGGFTCTATLRDDRGNTWQGQTASDFKLPTDCNDDDHPFTPNKPGQVAQVYVVPASAVPHLNGLVVNDNDDYRSVMITP
jgi:hypothetical protein